MEQATLPPEILEHLLRILGESREEWSRQKDALGKLQHAWQRKDGLFDEQTSLLGMKTADLVGAADPRGMLLLTFSGSLISLGWGEERSMEYASIKFRTDVPDILRCERTMLEDVLRTGRIARFVQGPLKKTSAIYKIACCPEGLPPEEQNKRIREATAFLTASFVRINRDLTHPQGEGDGGEAGDFTKKGIVASLAEENGLSRETVRAVLEGYGELLEKGLLSGNTVSVGRLGRLSLKLKPRRKARLGRNPRTGEEITIPAREARFSPAFHPSPSLRDQAEALPVPPSEEDE